MSCSCHISPPCSCCISSYECTQCGKIKNASESEPYQAGNDERLICSKCFATDVVPTLDEWVDKNAADLKPEIECHIKVMAGELSKEDQDSLVRLIFISIRQWREDGKS